jgi:hypothetical protein
MPVPLPSVIADVISERSKEVACQGRRDYGEADIEDVISSALAVAGEIFIDDGFARMRIERKMSRLRFRIEQLITSLATAAGSEAFFCMVGSRLPRV